ncbi:hypothetical protein ASPTUDRAFT_89381, partial [Aspergillus tubingensis CBS 134.48]
MTRSSRMVWSNAQEAYFARDRRPVLPHSGSGISNLHDYGLLTQSTLPVISGVERDKSLSGKSRMERGTSTAPYPVQHVIGFRRNSVTTAAVAKPARREGGRERERDPPAGNGVREVSKGARAEVSFEANRASHRGTRSGE